MGNTGAKLLVKVNETVGPVHFSGTPLQGTIFLGVEKERIDCAELRIKLIGTEHCSVNYTESETYHENNEAKTRQVQRTATESSIFLQYDTVVCNFVAGYATQGRFEYPFSLFLAENLPTSFSGNNCTLSYMLEVRLDRPGWTKWDVTHQVPIQIVKAIPQPMITPLRLGPATQKISYCCMSTGDILLASMVDKNCSLRGQDIRIYYYVKNYSSTKIKAVSISLQETVHRRAHGHSDSSVHNVYETRIEADKIPGAASDTSRTLQEVMQTFDVEKALRESDLFVTFTMPVSVLPDFQGRLVQVQHRMYVQVHTVMCATNVEVESPFGVFSCFKQIVPQQQQPSMQHYIPPPQVAATAPPVDEQLPPDWNSAHVAVAQPVALASVYNG